MNEKLLQSSKSYQAGFGDAEVFVNLRLTVRAICALANLPPFRRKTEIVGTVDKSAFRYAQGFHDRLAQAARGKGLKLVYDQWNGVTACPNNGSTEKSPKKRKKKRS